MRKFAKLENGEWICQLTADEVLRLKRREGVRKNRAKITSKFSSIAANIEEKYGLPTGCIRVCKPGTSELYRRDVKIGTILTDYGE